MNSRLRNLIGIVSPIPALVIASYASDWSHNPTEDETGVTGAVADQDYGVDYPGGIAVAWGIAELTLQSQDDLRYWHYRRDHTGEWWNFYSDVVYDSYTWADFSDCSEEDWWQTKSQVETVWHLDCWSRLEGESGA